MMKAGNKDQKKDFGRFKSWLKISFLLVFAVVPLLLFNTVWASESEKASGQILSEELVSGLTQECDTGEIFLKAWVPNVNMETLPTEEEKKTEEELKKEITQILRACLKKELGAISCSDISCLNVDSGLHELRESILAKYFLDDKNMWYVDSEHGDSVAWGMYQEKLEKCYKEVFDGCDCNMQGLLDLWADLRLNDANVLETEKRLALAEKTKNKYEECLKAKIAEMKDVEEMMGLIFKEDKKDEYGLTLRDDTIYDNSNIARAILKRLIQLYGLDINLDDKYFSSRCCDKFLYLKDLYSWLKEYYLLGYPQLTRQERGGWDEENMIKFLRHMKALGDPYTHCRILKLNQCDCNPNKLCDVLGCKEHIPGEFKESMEKQLNDTREQEFLDALQRKIKECIGIDVELKDFINFCAYAPVNKKWENLKKELEEKEARESNELTEEEKEKLAEKIEEEAEEFGKAVEKEKKSKPKEKEIEVPVPKKEETKIKKGVPRPLELNIEDAISSAITSPEATTVHVQPGLVKIGEMKMPIQEEKKINIFLKERPITLKVASKKVFLEEGNVKVDVKLPIEVGEKKIKFKDKEIRITPKEALSKARVKQSAEIELIEKDKKLAYKIKTVERKRLFFIFPVRVERKILIDAGNIQGRKIEEKKPWWSFLAW